MTIRNVVAVFVLSAAGVAVPAAARASAIFDVVLDTTALTVAPGSASAPFSAFFQLTDGSGLGDVNNTVTIEDFAFGGGAPMSGASLTGGVTGDLGGVVTLTDSGFFNSFQQSFEPGTLVSFRVTMTTSVDAGGIPDAFAFSILDSTGVPVPTLDSSLADTLLTVNIDSITPVILTYATDPVRTRIALDAPVVSPAAAPVPEPGTLTLMGLGAGLAAVRKSTRSRPKTLA